MDAVRGQQEAKRLRRTLDRRVEEATRQATRQLRHMAMRDPLTDVGNRRFFEENLPLLVDSALASGTDLVCLAIDMDNFKKVNDTLGHAAGDELLIFLASLVDASTRQEDYVARLGGDEFMVLLPGAHIDRAADLAKQIIALFRQHVRTALPDELDASLSVGIASLNSSKAGSGTELVEAADRNLYKAKNQGKGCAVADAA
jgi:diguanylate cyclase (GGDEF)-like protein